jgi:hypothetical protein
MLLPSKAPDPTQFHQNPGGHLREALQGRMKIIARVNCITLAAIVLR